MVVDTSFWIGVLRGTESPTVKSSRVFGPSAKPGSSSATCARPQILRLESLNDFSLAAQLYRRARQAGIRIGKTIDCLIAAPCVRTGASLLHADADFDRLASCTPLKVFL